MYKAARKIDDTQALRQEAGKWLREQRENARLSQTDLAKLVNLEYYTFISQIETGRGRLPPAQYEAFAKAFGISLRLMAKTLMKYYDPYNYYALFEHVEPSTLAKRTSVKAGSANNDDGTVVDLAARIARLEAMLEDKLAE